MKKNGLDLCLYLNKIGQYYEIIQRGSTIQQLSKPNNY